MPAVHRKEKRRNHRTGETRRRRLASRDREPHKQSLLLIQKSRGLARDAANHEPSDPFSNMPVAESGEGLLVDPTLVKRGRNGGNKAARRAQNVMARITVQPQAAEAAWWWRPGLRADRQNPVPLTN